MKMTCRAASANAQDLIDGELPFGARVRTRAHLLICRNCRAHLGQLRQTISLVGAAVPRATCDRPEAFAAMLAERARSARSSRSL